MIIPESKLLWGTGLVLTPFAAAAGAFPETAGIGAVVIGLFLAAVLVDALLAPGAVAGVTVDMPELCRLTREREGHVDLHLLNRRSRPRPLRIGLLLPETFTSLHTEIRLQLPTADQRCDVRWPCIALERGRYAVDGCIVEGLSPLGFWAFRGRKPVAGEIRVYPNLLEERRNVAGIFLNRGTVGVHAQRTVGQGREFEKLREYVPGDSYQDIHWKATAKRGKPITKQFQVEHTQEVYVILDASRLSGRPARLSVPPGGGPPRETNLLERYIVAALLLAVAAERQGDLFGLAVFTDTVRTFVRAGTGKGHFNSCRDALYTVRPQTVNPDFDDVCAFLRVRLRRRALLVFLGSFDDAALGESFARAVRVLAGHHLVMVNTVTPPAVRPLFLTADATVPDDLYRALGGHVRWQGIEYLKHTLHRQGVRLSTMLDAHLCPDLISQYVNVKQRQLL